MVFTLLAVILTVVVLEAILAFFLFQPDNDATIIVIFGFGFAAFPFFLFAAGLGRMVRLL